MNLKHNTSVVNVNLVENKFSNLWVVGGCSFNNANISLEPLI